MKGKEVPLLLQNAVTMMHPINAYEDVGSETGYQKIVLLFPF